MTYIWLDRREDLYRQPFEAELFHFGNKAVKLLAKLAKVLFLNKLEKEASNNAFCNIINSSTQRQKISSLYRNLQIIVSKPCAAKLFFKWINFFSDQNTTLNIFKWWS